MTVTVMRRAVLAALSFLTFPAFVPPAHADAVSAMHCQQTIGKELRKFVKTKSRILRRCKENVVKRGTPATPVDCPLTPQDDQINAGD